MIIDDVHISVTGFDDMGEEEIKKYINHIIETDGQKPSYLRISPTNKGEVNLHYEIEQPKFERIRRITGL